LKKIGALNKKMDSDVRDSNVGNPFVRPNH
jgi:hypothetical protein